MLKSTTQGLVVTWEKVPGSKHLIPARFGRPDSRELNPAVSFQASNHESGFSRFIWSLMSSGPQITKTSPRGLPPTRHPKISLVLLMWPPFSSFLAERLITHYICTTSGPFLTTQWVPPQRIALLSQGFRRSDPAYSVSHSGPQTRMSISFLWGKTN